MQLIETSDGICIFNVIDSEKETSWLNHDEILNMAHKNPSKAIILSDSPSYLINDDTFLSLLSEGKPENINVSAELWSKLNIKNFKNIRKTLLNTELGNIIGNGEDSVDRAKAALEILTPHGMEDLKIDNKSGKEEILANVEGQECVVKISLGRIGNGDQNNILYEEQLGTNLRLTISTENNDEEFPKLIDYKDGNTYKVCFSDPEKIIYIPERINKFKSYSYDAIKRKFDSVALISEKYNGRELVYSTIADVSENYEEIIDPFENYAVIIDGELYFHMKNSQNYMATETEYQKYQDYIVFPSLTLFK